MMSHTPDGGTPGECGRRTEDGHVCIKGLLHVDDITDDDHTCCCGTHWEDPPLYP